MTGAIRNHRTLIAEQSAPSLLAVALPGLLTGTMETAGVADAVVAVTAAEAHPTPRPHKENNNGLETEFV